MNPILSALALVFALALTGTAHSADSTPEPSTTSWLAEVRQSVKAGQFDQAIKQLQTANQTSSADWNNLMGFSLRKKQPADLTGSEKFYVAALNIDPAHKGALEYYGELKLLNKDLPGAEALLVRLDKACLFSCEEYRDLKQAIQKYKNNK